MLAQTVAALSFAPSAPASAPSKLRSSSVVMETVSDLKSLATQANPVLGYWCVRALPDRAAG